MKTINIKGKEYVPVVERVKEFHKLFPQGDIQTELPIIENTDGRVVVKATVNLGDGRKFTGFSQAEWGKGMMGGVALEVAETSAIGRALGFANIGLLDGIASADEMRKVKTIKQTNTESSDDDDIGF
jgi:hypothetical protein